MTTFLVAHGAWSAGWVWRKMHPLLQTRGHRLVTPTYTGLGERAHLLDPEVNLDTHIADLLGVLHMEDLVDVTLVAHSYGGMVGTGVADRARDRVSGLIYLDAFVPGDGQALVDLLAPEAAEAMAASAVDGWQVPPNPIPPDTSAEDIDWITPRRLHQPIATFRQPLQLVSGPLTLPRAYVYCRRSAPGDVFRQFADAAEADPAAWRYAELDASHNPHITAPEALADLLEQLAS